MLEIVQQLFTAMGINGQVNLGDLYGLGSILFLIFAMLSKLLVNEKKSIIEVAPKPDFKTESKAELKTELKTEPKSKTELPPTKVIKISWNERLTKGLSRSSSEVWGKVFQLFSGKISEEMIEEVEELLYGADLGPKIVSEIITQLEEEIKNGQLNESDFKKFLFDYLKSKMQNVQENVSEHLYGTNPQDDQKLKVIMIVGVNGAGKTTTIGKLATKLTRQGSKVVVGACDTFRAAAVDQLQVWCERAGATMVRAKEGANPTGVGYDSLKRAIAQKADYCLLDTAGRLHTKDNLMDELKKSKNVLSKLMPDAPHEVILVLDAITGQNALRQAEEFHKTLGLTGLVFTKCDGSSKAGSAISIVENLQVPISYIGVGESVDDLNSFNLDEYLHALLGAAPQQLHKE